MLEPVSRPCVAAAFRLYGGILDEIVAADYDVLARRVKVPTRRRLAVAAPGAGRALSARISSALRPGHRPVGAAAGGARRAGAG
jgi:phytoene synthase